MNAGVIHMSMGIPVLHWSRGIVFLARYDVTGCTGGCHFDNFWWRKWLKLSSWHIRTHLSYKVICVAVNVLVKSVVRATAAIVLILTLEPIRFSARWGFNSWIRNIIDNSWRGSHIFVKIYILHWRGNLFQFQSSTTDDKACDLEFPYWSCYSCPFLILIPLTVTQGTKVSISSPPARNPDSRALPLMTWHWSQYRSTPQSHQAVVTTIKHFQSDRKTLKLKCLHPDEIPVTGRTEGCQNDGPQCSQQRKSRQKISNQLN